MTEPMTTERSSTRIDAAILDIMSDDWMPWAAVAQAIWDAFGDPAIGHRIHVLERRGLIESRIWGQGDERQLWLRRVEQEDR